MKNLPAVIHITGEPLVVFFDPAHVEKADWETPGMGKYIKCLGQFGVVGFQYKNNFLMVKDFLFRRGIVHCSNERGLLWLPELKGSLRDLLGR